MKNLDIPDIYVKDNSIQSSFKAYEKKKVIYDCMLTYLDTDKGMLK